MPISQSVPKVFTDYINKQKLENVELRKIKRVKFTITQKEAYEDLHVFQYIINNSYSGREYWENQGVDFKKIYDNIGAYIKSNNLVPIHEMFNLYGKQLQDIHDGHLSLSSFNNCINFGKKYKVYFADVLLEKAIVLKDAGKEIIGLMLEKMTTEEIVSLLSDKYNIPLSAMGKDVVHFSEELHEADFYERIAL